MSVYFIDSQNGSDTFNGLSPDTAFATLEKASELPLKSGDRVLLKRGCRFIGRLIISDSGKEYNNITVSYYGEAVEKPVIVAPEKSESAVSVTGEYVTVDGLEITNPTGQKGLMLKSELHGATHGVIVSNCYIHDVGTVGNFLTVPERSVNNGAGWEHADAGICVETNKEAPTWYENVRIESNRIENVNRTGIWFSGQWFNRFKNCFPWVVNKADGMDDPWYPHKNIYIGHNYVDHSFGDGIIGIGCKNLLMEHNKVFYANCQSRMGGANAALWSMCCDGAVIQYNEVAYTNRDFGGDGQALDIDIASRDTIVQYNYTHDNAGGFMLLCNGACNSKHSHCRQIIRNNLSVNDAKMQDAPIFTFDGPMRDITIINNTVYKDDENRFRFFNMVSYGNQGMPQDILFANNLVYSKSQNNWSYLEANGPIRLESNILHNIADLPEKDNITVDNLPSTVNPVLTGDFTVPGTRLEFADYVPLWFSPLLRLGRHYEASADKDFRGESTEGHNYVGAFYYKDYKI